MQVIDAEVTLLLKVMDPNPARGRVVVVEKRGTLWSISRLHQLSKQGLSSVRKHLAN